MNIYKQIKLFINKLIYILVDKMNIIDLNFYSKNYNYNE